MASWTTSGDFKMSIHKCSIFQCQYTSVQVLFARLCFLFRHSKLMSQKTFLCYILQKEIKKSDLYMWKNGIQQSLFMFLKYISFHFCLSCSDTNDLTSLSSNTMSLSDLYFEKSLFLHGLHVCKLKRFKYKHFSITFSAFGSKRHGGGHLNPDQI